MTPPRPKLFVLGYPGSGASRIKAALGHLGYRLAEIEGPANARLLAGKSDPDKVLQTLAHQTAERMDGLAGAPLAFLSAVLDGAYPEARFILPVVAPEAWLAAHAVEFRANDTPLHKWMFGTDSFAGNEAVWSRVLTERMAAIRAQFADRPGALLELDLGGGQGWMELVGFLGRDLLPPLPEAAPRAVKRAAPVVPVPLDGEEPAPVRQPRTGETAASRKFRAHASRSDTDAPSGPRTERIDARGFAADADRPRKPRPAGAERPERAARPGGPSERGGKPRYRGPADAEGKPSSRPRPAAAEGKPAYRARSADVDGKQPYRARSADGDGRPPYRSGPAGAGKPAYRGRPEGDDKPPYRGKPGGAGKPGFKGRAAVEAKPAFRARPADGDGKPGFRGKPGGAGKPGRGTGPGPGGPGKPRGPGGPARRKPGPPRDN